MSQNENELRQLQETIAAIVRRVLQERGTDAEHSALSTQHLIPPRGKVLVAVCCGDCVNEQAEKALHSLAQNGIALTQPEESEFKKRALREKLVSENDAVLLPSVGDDDAAKMATGIFDEPVARVALTALAMGKPVFMALNAPYEEGLKRHAPALRRVFESHRRALESFGFRLVPTGEIDAHLSKHFGALPDGNDSTPATTLSASKAPAGGKKKLVTAQDVEAAAQNGEKLALPSGAIVTPLARDRARELGVTLG